MKLLRRSILLCVLVFIALCGCKTKAPESKSAPAPATDAAAADVAKADAPAADAAAKAEPKPDAAPAMVCSRWGNNAFFIDGNTLTFEYENEDCEMDEENPWNDEEQEWNATCSTIKGTLECRVKLVLAESDYCASELRCELKGDSVEALDPNDLYPHGLWAIDNNGVVYVYDYTIGESALKRRTAPTDCTDAKNWSMVANTFLKYAKCEAGSFLHNYIARIGECSIPFVQSDVHEEEEDDGYQRLDISYKKTQWTSVHHVSGVDGCGVCDTTYIWDEQRGLVKYDEQYGGCMGDSTRVTAK